jgi:hypothetical protein
MKITIESTDEIVTIDGVECRHWKGTTENGTPCEVFVHRIAVRDDAKDAFDRELREKPLQNGDEPPQIKIRSSRFTFGLAAGQVTC